MIAALLMAALASTAPEGAPDSLGRILGDAEQWVLDGKSLPPDYLIRIEGLEPADRFIAIVYLRRAGLLVGPAVDLDRLLETKPRSAP